MKVFKYIITWLFVILVFLPGYTQKSAGHQIIIRIVPRNFVSVQSTADETSNSPAANTGRIELNWKINSVLKKMTMSVNQEVKGSTPVRPPNRGDGKSTDQPYTPSRIERDIIPAFSKTSGSMEMERCTASATLATTDGAVNSLVTYTILDI